MPKIFRTSLSFAFGAVAAFAAFNTLFGEQGIWSLVVAQVGGMALAAFSVMVVERR